MKRYVSLDFIRGISIVAMIFVHILDDLYDLSWTKADSTLEAAPLVAVIMLIIGIFLGAWCGLFLMISATGNMVSMHKSLERGKPVMDIVLKQVLGGFILLIFGFLAEGTLQYYGLFQTIRAGNVDFTRILWKGYTMETIHAIAWCMIVNGIVQGLLSINSGYKKIKRNMIIYGVLAILVIFVTQFIWDAIRLIIPDYPLDPLNTGRSVQSPVVGASFGEYILKFFLLPLGGQPEPLFPYLAVSFIGSIIGLAICRENISRTWPKKGVFIGISIFIIGIFVAIIGDMPMDSFLPLDDFMAVSRIGNGLDWRWLPWFLFITGGQIAFVSLMFRFIEFRGKSEKFAEKTKFIRRFGMVAFTLYTFHRTIAMIPLGILTLIFQRDVMIDCHNLNGWATLGCIGVSILFMHYLIKLWEKKDYIGSLEWMIGSIGAYILGIPKKSKEKKKWYQWGAKDQNEVFYNVEWIDIFQEGDNGGVEHRNSKFALKLSIAGFLLFPCTILGLSIAKSSRRIESENKYNILAWKIGIIAAIVNVSVIISLIFINLQFLGLSL